ncbi:hypothetical protein [Profundibacter sp.]
MIRSNQAGQAKNRPPRREEGENGNLQRFPLVVCEYIPIYPSAYG